MRRLMLGIVFDETINRLVDNTKNKDYVKTEIRKVSRKHYSVSKDNIDKFNTAYELMNEAYLTSQRTFIKLGGLEFSNVLLLKFMIEGEPSLVKYFKLNQKHFDKMYNQHDLTKHILRTKKFYNELMKQIDIVIAHYEYNKDKK